MQGQIFKIHSDFYYVNTPDGVFECKIRDVLKKQKAQRILCAFARLFVTTAGKYASGATLKASAMNCAVLPLIPGHGFVKPVQNRLERHAVAGLHQNRVARAAVRRKAGQRFVLVPAIDRKSVV